MYFLLRVSALVSPQLPVRLTLSVFILIIHNFVFGEKCVWGFSAFSFSGFGGACAERSLRGPLFSFSVALLRLFGINADASFEEKFPHRQGLFLCLCLATLRGGADGFPLSE